MGIKTVERRTAVRLSTVFIPTSVQYLYTTVQKLDTLEKRENCYDAVNK